MGWAHQSYAEFLAADYLVTKHSSPENILKILCHPSGGLVPQLWSVAAWVASRSREVRRGLIAQEPFALLRGDLLSWSQDDRAALTGALLTAFEEQRAHDFAIGIANDYRKLAHPGLADQLRPYIVDTAKHVIARRSALMIARACSLRELQSDLLDVALNPTDDPSIRPYAISALGTCGDQVSKAQLLPLADDQLGPDPNQEIKGQALKILWPHYLTGAELFGLITPPADGHVGAYVMFLTDQLPKSLSDVDLLPALEWANGYVSTANQFGEFHAKHLVDGIFIRAWEYVDNPEIMRAFSQHVRLRIRKVHKIFLSDMGHDHDEFRDKVRANDKKKREFLLTILADEQSVDPHEAFSFLRVAFLQNSDLDWLLSISPFGSSPATEINPESLFALIDVVFNPWEPSHFEALYDIAMRWMPLHQRYEALLDGVLLDSPTALRMREHHQLTIETENNGPPPVDPPPADRVRMDLERFEAGDLRAWWMLNLDLTLSLTSTHYDQFQCRITKMPGWMAADEPTRGQILRAAKTFLEQAQPLVEKWLGTNSYRHSDLSAYRALVLIREVERETYDSLDPVIWARWAPVVVAVPKETGAVEGKYHDQIAADASAKAPHEFALTVRRLIRGERRRTRAQAQTSQPKPIAGVSFLVLRTLDECWGNKTLREVVYSELKNRNNSPAQCEALLEPLLRAGYEPARDFAAHLLTNVCRGTSSRQLYLLAVATQLLAHCATRSWPAVWKLISADQQLGCDLFQKLGHEYRHDQNFYSTLSEVQLGELYLWLEQAFPHHADPRHQRGGKPFWAGPRDSVALLRDRVLSYLVTRGTEQSVEVLRQIITQLNDRQWLVLPIASS
jgi:hypothetical protein